MADGRRKVWRIPGLGDHKEQEVIDALIRVSEGDADHLRDWATFCLGTLFEMSSPLIRNALRPDLMTSEAMFVQSIGRVRR